MLLVSFWVGIIMIIPKLIEMIGRRSELFNKLSPYMPMTIISNITFNEITEQIVLEWTTPEGILKSIIVSLIGCTLFYFIGLGIFKKREVK